MRLYEIKYDYENPMEIISKEAEPFLDRLNTYDESQHLKNFGFTFRFHILSPAKLLFDIDFNFKEHITLYKDYDTYDIHIIPIINKIKGEIREEIIKSILDETLCNNL